MPADSDRKKCFVIGPIGAETSEVRRKADWLLEEIVRPVLEAKPFDYDVTRADQVTEPGLITDQIIASVIDADLVVADLTGHNANAFYELAVRHMEERPVIHMIMDGERPPFDLKDYRTVSYRLQHPSDLRDARNQLSEQVKAIESPSYQVTNPIIKARGYKELARSKQPEGEYLAQLAEKVERLDGRLSGIEEATEVAQWRRLHEVLDVPEVPNQVVRGTRSILEALRGPASRVPPHPRGDAIRQAGPDTGKKAGRQEGDSTSGEDHGS